MTLYAQTVCIVLRAGKTLGHAVERAISLLMSSGSRSACLILNRLRRSHGLAIITITVPMAMAQAKDRILAATAADLRWTIRKTASRRAVSSQP